MEIIGNAVKFVVGNAVAEVAAERREQKRRQEEANA